MNRNGRRIALGLVAIVLGAGFLLKVIPPETDVGINDRHLINIDGSLVSNPLDINELPQLALSPLLTLYPAVTQPVHQSESLRGPADLSPLVEADPFFQALPSTPGVHSGKPPASGTGPKDSHQPGKPEPVGSDHPLMPGKPSDELIAPVLDNRRSNPPSSSGTPPSSPGSSTPPGTPNPTIPDPTPPLPSIPGPTSPDPKNPDPTEPGPIIELPKTPPSAPDVPGPDQTPDPLPGVPPIPNETPKNPDYPTTQSVPDPGATIAMIGAAVAGLLVLNRRFRLGN